jgi:peptidoglycan/LPS O-acetylase OafA/YrhL
MPYQDVESGYEQSVRSTLPNHCGRSEVLVCPAPDDLCPSVTEYPRERARTNQVHQHLHVGALDGIRGLAVAMVFLYHYGDLSHSTSQVARAVGLLKVHGNSGVDIFFVLSGFLISGILFDTVASPHRWRNFYARRSLRVFPLYYGVWAFLALYVLAQHLSWPQGTWAYLAYLGNLEFAHKTMVGPFIAGHFWSLAVEEQFYLLWPLIVWKIGDLRKLTYILVFLCGISFGIKLICVLLHHNLAWTYFLLPTRMEGLATGSLCAIAVRRLTRSQWLQISRWAFPCSVLAAIGIDVAADFHQPIFGNLLWFQTMAIAAGSMLLLSLDQGSVLSKIFSAGPLRFIGRYSYGIYVYSVLIHNWLALHLKPIVYRNPQDPKSGVVYLIACIGIVLGISMASFHCCERPFLRLKKHFE